MADLETTLTPSDSLPTPRDNAPVDLPPATTELRESLRPRQIPWGWAAAIIVALLYGVTWHPWWTNGGDAELYLSAARNVARGDGFRYNGQPIGLITPLWVWMIAGALKLTTSVGLLKLLTLGSVWVFLWCSYRVLLQMVTPAIAAITVVCVAMLHPMTELADTFFSDPPFLAATWLCLLTCLVSRDRADRGKWVSAVLAGLIGIALLVASTMLRWPGFLWTPAAMLVFLYRRGNRAPPMANSRKFRWAMVIVLALVGAGTFIALRYSLKIPADQIDPRYDAFITGGYEMISDDHPKSQFELKKIYSLPDYVGVLSWNLVQRDIKYRYLSQIIALAALVPMVIVFARQTLRGRWLWIGPIVYLMPIVLRWPHPIGRYVLPAAPVMIAAFLVGVVELWRWRKSFPILSARQSTVPAQNTDRFTAAGPGVVVVPGRINVSRTLLGRIIAVVAGVYVIVIGGLFVSYNGAAWALEVMASHRATWRESSLVAVGEAVRDLEGEVVVTSIRYENKRRLRTAGQRRAIQFIADRPLLDAPPIHGQWPNRELMEWAQSNNARWFVDQARSRKFGPLYQGPSTRGEWRLWEVDDSEPSGWRRVEVPVPDRTPDEFPWSPTGRP